jgi:hypothetical protein
MFSADTEELEQAISYEMFILEYFRRLIFGSDAEIANKISINLWEKTEGGDQIFRSHHEFLVDSSAGDVQSALNKLRPMAFVAAFKLHDMIAEWILKRNGASSWRFKEKIQRYKALKAAGSFIEPDYFLARPNVSEAFWEIYASFLPYRNKIVHHGGVSSLSDGSIAVSKTGTDSLIKSYHQSAYASSLFIIAKCLLGHLQDNPHLDAVVHSYLARLKDFHRVNNLSARHILLYDVFIRARREDLECDDPIRLVIDWDNITQYLSRQIPHGVDGEVFFSATVSVEIGNKVATWSIPLDSVPAGNTALIEGLPPFNKFLTFQGR